MTELRPRAAAGQQIRPPALPFSPEESCKDSENIKDIKDLEVQRPFKKMNIEFEKPSTSEDKCHQQDVSHPG